MDYILKFTGCLLVLYTFYRLFFENEKNHHFKRFYLLFTLAAAVAIPLITLTYEVEANNPTIFSEAKAMPQAIDYPETINSEIVREDFFLGNYYPIILWIIYGTGFVVFALRFINNLNDLNKLILRSEIIKEQSNTKVLLSFPQIPFSYFRYIFVEKEAFKAKTFPNEILKHEEAHVHQKHTLDLLILEVLQIVFWFNPLFIFIKKSMRLNHEFLADEAVLNQNFNPLTYSNLLLEISINSHQNGITSSFNHSLIKKRILMISNSFSKKRVILKMGLLLPILCCCIYFFNNDIVAKSILLENQKANAILDKNPVLFFTVTNTQIAINNEEVLLKNFAKKFDQATKSFSDYDLLKVYIKFESKDVPKNFQRKFENEFFKTRYYKLLKKVGRASSMLFPPIIKEVSSTSAFQVSSNPIEDRANESKIYTHRETPTEKIVDIWNSSSKDVQFFLDNKQISYSALKNSNLESILLYSEQTSEAGSIIKLYTEINDYFERQPPVDFQNPDALKDIQDIFVNEEKVSKEELKAYKASDFKAYRIFQDGKKDAGAKFQLYFYTNKKE